MSTPTPEQQGTQLMAYVKGSAADAAFINECQAQATTMVDRYTKGRTVPADIKHRAVLEVGADLFFRRATRNGVAGFDDQQSVPVHIARDPMRAAYAILAPFTGPGIA